jgi:hypothetical protein
MRITSSGNYLPCRWMAVQGLTQSDMPDNIKSITPDQYFQNNMSTIRQNMLEGKVLSMCENCNIMEQHGKVSGRQKQLLKIGIRTEYFEKSLASSPMRPAFDYSAEHQGHTTRLPVDWQIDLGNNCNSACVFCVPQSSSVLATELKQLGLIDQLPPRAWCNDPALLDKFVDTLARTSNLHYLHFIGGETLITPGFKQILQRLVDADLCKHVTIGFTTNLATWSEPVIELLSKFQHVNLGMSVETLTPLNDYVRYPSKLEQVKNYLDNWVDLAQEHQWLMQLRTTPTCLTVHDLHTVYEFAWQNNICIESCNFLERPEIMRIGVLPQQMREQAISKLRQWINTHTTEVKDTVINIRDPNLAQTQIIQDAMSYLSYMESAPDESYRLPDLIAYLKKLENHRGNRILDYLPEYEQLFRSNGY